MAQFDNTKGAARRIRSDAQSTADDVRGDVRGFVSASREQAGAVSGDARQLVSDVTEYFQHWIMMIREDLTHEARATATSAGLGVGAGFVAALGFLLVNMGVIWWLSNTDTGVGPWFVIFGAAWILVGAILGAVAYSLAKKATRNTSARLKEDAQIPKLHAQTLSQRLQEQRNDASTAH